MMPDHLRECLGRHLQADRDAQIAGGLPGRIGLRIVEPGGLVRHGAADGEQPQPGELPADPVADALARVARQHVHREHPGKAVGMRCDSIGDVGIVVAIAGRGLHHGGLADPGLVHGLEHLLGGHRSRTRPFRLVAAERRQRIALGVGGDDVRVNVDYARGHRAGVSGIRHMARQRARGIHSSPASCRCDSNADS